MFIDIKKDNILIDSIQEKLNENILHDKGVIVTLSNTINEVTLKKVPKLPTHVEQVQIHMGVWNKQSFSHKIDRQLDYNRYN